MMIDSSGVINLNICAPSPIITSCNLCSSVMIALSTVGPAEASSPQFFKVSLLHCRHTSFSGFLLHLFEAMELPMLGQACQSPSVSISYGSCLAFKCQHS
uniref:Putative ovule protein n=1 Tax=Solanum chacoense TaxID=4108 RepID=A0A0V0H0D6_SOLCH